MVQARDSRMDDIELSDRGGVTLVSSVPGHTWGSIHQDIFSERSLHWTINRADIIYTHGALLCENKSRRRRELARGVRSSKAPGNGPHQPNVCDPSRYLPNPLADVYAFMGQKVFFREPSGP